MKRRWNFSLWSGFFLVLAGLLSYIPFFALFPITRDFPWVNLLFFAAGGVFLWSGLRRAFGQPELYHGKVFGTILAALSVTGIGFFAYGLFYVARQLPAATEAPRIGQTAPDFTLPDQNGRTMKFAELLASQSGGRAGAKGSVLLIFYRGHW